MTVERLPRGNHGLTREEVVRSQRGRILRGLAESMAVKGYVRTTVADVLRAAGVSRETFYEQFSSKEDCFMQAHEQAIALLMARIEEAFREHRGAGNASPPAARAERTLGAYLETLAAEPAFARVFLIEVYAAGPAALERRALYQRRFAALVERLLGARTREQRFAAEALVAATSSMVTTQLAAGDLEGLRALRKPLAKLATQVLATGT
jgi:AcrR family transcriptional regulator